MRGLAAAVLAQVCASGFACGAFGQSLPSGYVFVDLPPLAGGTTSVVHAINNSGMSVGLSRDGAGLWTAVLWTPDGQAAELGIAGEIEEYWELDINDNGDVLYAVVSGGQPMWSVRFADGTTLPIEIPAGYDIARVYAMNAFGDVCGLVFQLDDDFQYPAVWRPTPMGYEAEVISSGASVTEGYATALNDAGLVATTGRYANGHTKLINRRTGVQTSGFSGMQYSAYVDLNNAGVGVVRHDYDNPPSAATVPGVGDIVPFGCVDGSVHCIDVGLVLPYAINESRVVVGSSTTIEYVSNWPDGENGINEAFVWSVDAGTRKLADFVIEGDTTGWFLERATDINDAGWIVGSGTKDGQPRAFLLIPREPCAGDTNRDGQVTPADFGAWISAFNSGCD